MRWLPHSLAVRLFLIMLGAVLLAVLLTAGLARRDHSATLRRFRLHAAISHLNDAVLLLSPLSPESRTRAASGLPPQEWSVLFGESPTGPQARPAPELAWILAKRLGPAAHVDSAWIEQPAHCEAEPVRCPPGSRTALLRVRFPDGQIAQLGYRRVRERPAPEQRGFLVGVSLFAAILAAASGWAVRLALRPLGRMARAADDLGRDIAHPPMEESGPDEVRQAARAFNAMQQRIRASIAERTQILAAVTHDLKTPLTRMQLRLEQCPDPALRDRLQDDLEAMRSLVDEGLELARSLETGEPMQPVDLGALLSSLCDDAADSGQDVRFETLDPGNPVLVRGRPNALRRVFSNLIDNAVKYGHHARVALDPGPHAVRVLVRDAGPGIPEEWLSEVRQPFVRLESSRSRDTGGTGLGLAIAENLLKSHHGQLRLCNSASGGLEAVVTLPPCPSAPKPRRSERAPKDRTAQR